MNGDFIRMLMKRLNQLAIEILQDKTLSEKEKFYAVLPFVLYLAPDPAAYLEGIEPPR